MSLKTPLPEANGQVSDAVRGNWVDTKAPAWTRPYLRLSRADRPIGTWLLLLPCWWGLLLGILQTDHATWHDLWIFIGCAIGAFLMRGAGCTWNDITDRDFDGSVERTKSRPIPSGQVSVKQALAWMGLQAVISFGILLTFNSVAIGLGVLSIMPVLVYPFAKRFTWWPQVFLGIAFNWGALLAYSAHTGHFGWPSLVLYLSGIAWTLFYDTIYAHQDKEDDALIGIKSTARLFGDKSPHWLYFFAVLSTLLMIAAIGLVSTTLSGVSLWLAYLAAPAFLLHMLRQMRQIDYDDSTILVMLFRSNRNAGLLPVLFFAAAMIM